MKCKVIFRGWLAICAFFAIIPWVSGSYDFRYPGSETALPHLRLIGSRNPVYMLSEIPIRLLHGVPSRTVREGVDFLFFAGEGPLRPRPFFIFAFWAVLGCISIIVRVLVRAPSPRPVASNERHALDK